MCKLGKIMPIVWLKMTTVFEMVPFHLSWMGLGGQEIP